MARKYAQLYGLNGWHYQALSYLDAVQDETQESKQEELVLEATDHPYNPFAVAKAPAQIFKQAFKYGACNCQQ
jgi:hypothetical protein